MESITIQQQQQFVGQQQNGQVEFQFVRSTYPTGVKLTVFFTLPTTGVCKPESGDWVGIFKVGWTSLKDMKCRKMINVEEVLRKSTGTNVTCEHVEFETYELPTETQQYYQFVYVKNGEFIRGASKPFIFEEVEYNNNYPSMPSVYLTTTYPVEYKKQYQFTTTGKQTEGELQGMFDELRQREEKISNIRKQLAELKSQQEKQQYFNGKPEQFRQLNEQSRILEQELENGLESLQFGLKTMTVQGGAGFEQQPQYTKYTWENEIQQIERKIREQQQLKQEQRHIELQQIQIQIRQLEILLAKQQQREIEQHQREYQQIQWQIREFEQRVQQGSRLTGVEVSTLPTGQFEQQEQQVQHVRKLESFLKERLQSTVEKRQRVWQNLENRIRQLRSQLNRQKLNEFQFLIRHHQKLREQCKQISEQYMQVWQETKPTGKFERSVEYFTLPERHMNELRYKLRELETMFAGEQRVEEAELREQQESLNRYVSEVEMDLKRDETEHEEIVAKWQIKYQKMPEYVNFNGSIMQQQKQFELEYRQQVQQRIEQLKQQIYQQQQSFGGQQPRESFKFEQIKSLEQQIVELKTQMKGQLNNGEYTPVEYMPRQWVKQLVQKLREFETYIRMEVYSSVSPVYQIISDRFDGKEVQARLWLERSLSKFTQWIKFFEYEFRQPTEQIWTEAKINFVLTQLREILDELVSYKKTIMGGEQFEYPRYEQSTQTTTTRFYQLAGELECIVFEKTSQLKEILMNIIGQFTSTTTTTPFSGQQRREFFERLWEQIRGLEGELDELRTFEYEQSTTRTTPFLYQLKRQYEIVQQRLVDLERNIFVEGKEKFSGEYKQQQSFTGKYEQVYQFVWELESLWRFIRQQQYPEGEVFFYPQEQQYLHVQQRQLFRQIMRLIVTLETISQETTKFDQFKQQWEQIPTESFYFGKQVQLLQKIRTLKHQIPIEQHQIALTMIHKQVEQYIMFIEGKFLLPTQQNKFRKFKQMLKDMETRFFFEQQYQVEELIEQLKQQSKYQVELQQLIRSIERYLIDEQIRHQTTGPRSIQYYIRLVRDLYTQLRCWEECIFEQEFQQQQQQFQGQQYGGQEIYQTLKELVGSEVNKNYVLNYEQEQPFFGGLWGLTNGEKTCLNGSEVFFGQPEQFFGQQYYGQEYFGQKYSNVVFDLVKRYIETSYNKRTGVEGVFRRKFEELFVEQSILGQQIRRFVYEYIQMHGYTGVFSGLFGGFFEQFKQQQPRLTGTTTGLRFFENKQENLFGEESVERYPKGTIKVERISTKPTTYKNKFESPVEYQLRQMAIQGGEVEQQFNTITKPTFNGVRSTISDNFFPTESVYTTTNGSTKPEEQYKSVGIEVRFPEQQQPTIRFPEQLKTKESTLGWATGLTGFNGLTGLNGKYKIQKYSHVQKEMKQGNGETVVSDVEQIQFVICPLCGVAVNKFSQPEFELHVNSHFTD